MHPITALMLAESIERERRARSDRPRIDSSAHERDEPPERPGGAWTAILTINRFGLSTGS